MPAWLQSNRKWGWGLNSVSEVLAQLLQSLIFSTSQTTRDGARCNPSASAGEAEVGGMGSFVPEGATRSSLPSANQGW